MHAAERRGERGARKVPIPEVEIRSVGALIDALTPEEPDLQTGRRRDSGVYHGGRAPELPLLTSLDRLGGTDPPHSKAHLEGFLLRNFARYSRPYLPAEPINDWELLVIAQHHGAPTRLLDWSYSPLVAAHFATRQPDPSRPRVVWRLDWRQIHAAYNLPGLALLIDDLQHLFAAPEPFTPWQLFEGPTPPFACMIEPPSLNERVSAQAAVFTLCSDTSQSFDAFLAAQGLASALTKFVIPGEAVAAVRDQLDLVGIDDRRLFPGLDGVAAALRHYYA